MLELSCWAPIGWSGGTLKIMYDFRKYDYILITLVVWRNSRIAQPFCMMRWLLCFFCHLQECCIAMPLSQIIFFEEQAAGIGKRSVENGSLKNTTSPLPIFVVKYAIVPAITARILNMQEGSCISQQLVSLILKCENSYTPACSTCQQGARPIPTKQVLLHQVVL